MPQHPFAVIPRGGPLDHHGLAGRGQAGQKDRRLDLCRGDRQLVEDRLRVGGARQSERHVAAVAGDHARAHSLQRRDDSGHGPAAQGLVAGQNRRDRMAGQDTHEQAGAGARVAQVQHALGFAKPAHAAAPDMPDAVPAALDLGAEGPHRSGGAQDVLAFEQAVDLAFADRQGGEHQRPVRNRLVAGHARVAGQGFDRVSGERFHGDPDFPLAAGPGGARSLAYPGAGRQRGARFNYLLTGAGDRGNCSPIP